MTRRRLWVGALALALLAVIGDGARRAREIEAVTASRVGARLEPGVDPSSPSGYRWGQHRLVLPETDSYPWLLQAERSLAEGAIRVRAVDYDNAPAGREVHWAGFERWWVLGLAAAYGVTHPEASGPRAIERVAPWANTALLVVFLLTLTPLVGARGGALPAAVLALGCVAVLPLYRELRVGSLDHHGPAILSALLCVLFLAIGGAGWVRAAGSERFDRLLPLERAHRWFVASGVAGGVGLWISAATTAPVLLGVGLASLLSAGAGQRTGTPQVGVRMEAGLFRSWGRVGAITSLALYLVEYFPAHMGMRLEVNHPLYALAFLGGGDLVARVCALAGPGEASRGSALRWIALDLAAVLLVPFVILATGASTFRPSDPLLWNLHNRYIFEFLDLGANTRPLTPWQVVGQLSLAPLVALPVAALLWPTALGGAWRHGWRALPLAMVGAAAAYAYVFFLRLSGGSVAAGATGGAAAVALGFAWPLSARAVPLTHARQAALLLASLPAVAALGLALTQARWLGIAAALGLGALVLAVGVATETDRSPARARSVVFALAALVLVVPPAFFLREPYSPPNVGVITRDASLWLRRRVGGDPAVVFASPSATTYLIWFGGFLGLGTLYWENLEGLRASAEICGAPDADSARALLARHRVTHVAVFGWDEGLEQVERSAGGAGSDPAVRQMCTPEPGELPPWLIPLPYVPPRVAGFDHPVVRLYEVADDVPPAIRLARQARFYQALEDGRMEETLRRSLALAPSVPGLAMMTQLQQARGDRAGVAASAARLEEVLAQGSPVEPGDRLDAAIALVLAGEAHEASRQLAAALESADERQLRRLTPDRLELLVELSRQAGLDRVRPEVIALARELLRDPAGPANR